MKRVIAFSAITNGRMDTDVENVDGRNQSPEELNFIRDAALACMMNRAQHILYFIN
jgi:hypothetical protein